MYGEFERWAVIVVPSRSIAGSGIAKPLQQSDCLKGPSASTTIFKHVVLCVTLANTVGAKTKGHRPAESSWILSSVQSGDGIYDTSYMFRPFSKGVCVCLACFWIVVCLQRLCNRFLFKSRSCLEEGKKLASDLTHRT